MVVKKIAPIKAPKKFWQSDVPFESFMVIFIASFALGFITSLLVWLFTIDYVFLVIKK